MVTKEKILSETRGGLDIILDLYPQARVCLENKQAKFKKREEATPSAHLIEKDGIWYLKDFGESEKGKNGIALWMEFYNLRREQFGEACMQIARHFSISDELNHNVNRPHFVKREARSDEPDGKVVFQLKESFTKRELELLGPRVTQETCDSLHWHSVEWIGTAKNRQMTEKHSTDDYPIFIRECVVETAHGDTPEQKFYKQYEPKNPEKRYRFVYFPRGEKAPDYMNGLHEARQAHEALIQQKRIDWEATHKESEPFAEHKCKLPELIICSGERDALCVRSHGYWPIWFNSETDTMTGEQYDRLSRMAETIYNIPDIDSTGIACGTKLALRYIDLHTVWLPMAMRQHRDHRGKGLKDLRDWMDLRPTREAFRQLLMKGMPARFWTDRRDKDGNKTGQHEIDTEYLFHFLRLNGFYILHDDHAKETRFIRIEQNVVKSVTPRDIRAFVRGWASDDYNTQHHNIRNLILNTPRLSAANLDALPETELEFRAYTAMSQQFYFSNGMVSVRPDGLHWNPRNGQPLDTYVWEDNVIKHDWRTLPDLFKLYVERDDDGDERLHLDIIDPKSSHFFGYLINASRLYWRKEMEYPFKTEEERVAYRDAHRFDIYGAGLTPGEHAEQMLTLLSKMFGLGYILHEYKSPSRAWALMSLDNKVGEIDECNGRSGKSFFYVFLEQFRRLVTLSGRAGDLTKNPHWNDKVTEYTQVLMIDDMDERMPASFFYDSITGAMNVNPKNMQSYTIPFNKSPKLAFSTNYVPSDFDPSSDARLIYMVYSDYYHQRTSDNDYLETRTIRDDFGKELYTEDYTPEEWNADINFALQCVRMYLWLKQEYPWLKVQPPMENIRRRKLKREMGENFEEWAYQYFAEGSEHLDVQLVRTTVFEDFKRYSNVSAVKMKSFSRKLHAFAEVCPYIAEMDPEEYLNRQGRNISYEDDPLDATKKKATEMVFMRSVNEARKLREQKPNTEHTPIDIFS